jgi:AcrR family transcriptional regulator
MSAVRRQARGRARIESILDAAEQLVGEVGYDEMTTNAVAARAGISPGSLYQFFGNKGEILDGLIARCSAEMSQFWEAQLSASAMELPIDVVVDRVMDAIVAFKTSRPAFWALFHGSVTSDTLAEAARRLDGQLAERLDRVYAVRAPHLTPERRRLVAQVSVATVKSLMPLVMERTGTDSAAAIAELKRVLTGYLTPALAPPGSPESLDPPDSRD